MCIILLYEVILLYTVSNYIILHYVILYYIVSNYVISHDISKSRCLLSFFSTSILPIHTIKLSTHHISLLLENLIQFYSTLLSSFLPLSLFSFLFSFFLSFLSSFVTDHRLGMMTQHARHQQLQVQLQLQLQHQF